MNLFGIPIFVTKTMINDFLILHFSDAVFTPDQLFFAFLIINFMYLWFYAKVLVPFMYKVLMFTLNHVF